MARPSRASPAPWSVALWSLTVLGVLAGLVSAATDGVLHRVGLVILLASALAMAAVASSRKAPMQQDHAMGGSGYVVPSSRRVRVLHVVLTLLYTFGIMVVVLAALVRVRLVPIQFNPGIVNGFPLALGLYLLLLALAASWRIREQGGVIHAWYTRAHGIFLAILGSITLTVGALLVGVERVQSGELDILVGADLEVLALIGLLGVGTQLFLAANLPTLFDLGSGALRAIGGKEERKEQGAGTPPVLYAVLIAAAIAAVLTFVLTQLNVAAFLGNFKDTRIALVVLAVPLFLLAFFGVSALQIRREAQRGLYKQKLTAQARAAIVVYGFSGLAGSVFATLLFLNATGRLGALGPLSGTGLSMDLILLTLLSTTGPIGVYLRRRSQRLDAIEARLPDFLNDLAETRRAGLTLAAALQACSLSDYGALSKEIRKMADQVAWGVLFNDALAQFAQRVKTALVQRSTYLIIEASRTGGSVAEILKAAAKDAYEIKGLESERKTTMTTYLIVIYVVYFVFLSVISVLALQFIPQVIAANDAVANSTAISGGNINIGGTPFTQETINFSYFMAGMVQSIGNGLVGGVLSEGRVSAGLRHVAIMSLLTWVVFRLMVG
ncbi:MAG: type II secretion system F family protein [Candidatus Thermoplasmatota archaeon]